MDNPDIFYRIIEKMEAEIPAEEFHRWILPLRPALGETETLTIEVPNIFFKNWIYDKYIQRMKIIMAEIHPPTKNIELILGESEPVNQAIVNSTPPEEPEDNQEANQYYATLNMKYQFDNFVVGSSNQLAHAASKAIAYRTATYNPLFIYGGSGLGKTHLLNAIGNQLVSQDNSMKVLYMSSEDFTNELIDAIQSEGMSSFRYKYRKIDTLLIDDIQFIGGRERTQEEFFYTFNTLYEADKQIVLSSDKMPKEIPDLEDRLRSRFEGGLFADITPPDRETKVAILCKKAEEEGINLNKDVAFYLASQNESNIRVLEGYLARLGAYSSLTSQPINLDTTQRLLGLFMEDDRKQITLELIQKVTADYFNIKVADLKSNKKQKVIALPRQAAMYMARQLTSLSTIDIGQKFGGRDHSTVIHAVKRIEAKQSEDHNFARVMSELKKEIRGKAVS